MIRNNAKRITITRGRTGLKRFLTGSVASGIVQHAHRYVMIVR
ncbi:MAG TPA: universal stress protein [Nitrososphaeraceae archaeon]